MAKVYRSIFLKVVDHRIEGPFVSLPIHQIIRRICTAATTVSDRHFPHPSKAVDGNRCSFIDSMRDAPAETPGVVFRFGSYIKGELPSGLKPDFSGAKVDIAASKLTDVKTGDQREPVLSCNVLAWGGVVVMESIRGAGGVSAFETCLNDLIRRHINPDYPRISLIDVATNEISAAIDQGGGVQEVIIDAIRARPDATHTFGKLLSEARTAIGGTDLVRLVYKSANEDVLSKTEVLTAYDDLAAHETDKITIVLKDGRKFHGTEQCKVRRLLDFTTEPSDEAVAARMAQFVNELQRENDGVSVLTSDGNLA